MSCLGAGLWGNARKVGNSSIYAFAMETVLRSGNFHSEMEKYSRFRLFLQLFVLLQKTKSSFQQLQSHSTAKTHFCSIFRILRPWAATAPKAPTL